MGRSLRLRDRESVEDVGTYLSRARAVDAEGAVRFQAVGGAVGIWTCALAKQGLLDSTPTVLGLRTAGLSEASELDVVVSLAAVLDRIPRADQDDTLLGLPPHDAHAAWAGISPSLSGWETVAAAPAPELVRAARDGIEEVARTVPTDSGQEIVDRVRSQVWGRVSDWGKTPGRAVDVPDGAAFAAWSLGFLRADDSSEIPVAVHGTWARLACPGGFVLIRR